ncbi:hypothetical protein Tco_1104418 [Tanacetum coccineum]
MEKSTVSSLLEEKKRLKSDFKIREDKILDKKIQLENKIKELDNILVKTGQSIQTMHMLSPKPDSFYHTKQKMALGYQNPFSLKQAQLKQQSLYNGKALLEKHDPSTIHKIVKDETFPIVNQVDASVQNFKIQFLKEAAKFVQDFRSLAKEADESLAKHKALELEIERLLRAVVSQDIMSIVQCNSVVDTSNLQTRLERTKERFEKCIIKKENEYAKLWNDWFLNKRTPTKVRVMNTKFNTKFSNQTNLGKPSLQPLRNHSVIRQPNTFQSERPKRVPPKVVESNDLLNLVTSNSVPTTRELKVVENDKVIGPRMFRIDLDKTSREDKSVPINKVKASVRTKPIIVSQPHVITKNDVNSKTNGFSFKDVKNTTRTRRPQPRNKPKHDKVPSKSKSSCLSHNLDKIKENHRNLQSSSNQKHTSSACNNIKLAIQNAKSEVVYAMFKLCLINANHDVCA